MVHSLGKRCAYVSIFSIINGVEEILYGNNACSCYKNLSDTTLEINGLAKIETDIAIYVMFM